MKKSSFTKILRLLPLCIICGLAGCNNDDASENESDKSKVSVTINMNDVSWNSVRSTAQANASVSKTVVPLSDGLLIATLEPSQDVQTRASLNTGVRYRVIVYIADNVSASGYVCHGDFSVGGINPAFLLTLGPTYTFICYSYNTTDALPDFNQSQILIPVTANVDFLYCKKNVTITSSNSNIPLELIHSFSQISVIVESISGKSITACSGYFMSNYSAQVSVTDGSLTPNLSSGTPIAWPSLGTSAVTSTPIVVYRSTATRTSTVRLNSVTINGTTHSNKYFDFSNNIMQAGYKYTLRLKLREKLPKPVPNAIDLNRTVYWAPGNLIGTPNTDGTFSYTFALTQEYYSGSWDGGDYWNWCVLSPISMDYHEGEYSTSLDPCQKVEPAGFWRMPTLSEINLNTKFWATKNGVYGLYLGTAGVPESGEEDNYVFLPAAGIRYNCDVDQVQTTGNYWTATALSSLIVESLRFKIDDDYPWSQNTALGLAIRCVSDK